MVAYTLLILLVAAERLAGLAISLQISHRFARSRGDASQPLVRGLAYASRFRGRRRLPVAVRVDGRAWNRLIRRWM
jgi:hypothetical protein